MSHFGIVAEEAAVLRGRRRAPGAGRRLGRWPEGERAFILVLTPNGLWVWHGDVINPRNGYV
jgi:hypothetical protein